MKLIKLNNTGLYIIVDDYNTKEAYDSRITKGSVFYKDEFKDICIAEYSPASKVSRPVIASTNEYSNLGIKNSYGIPLINTKELNDYLKNNTGVDTEILSGLCCYDKRNPDCTADDEDIEDFTKSISKKDKCYCDNCFHGRTKLAEQIIKNSDKKFTLSDMEKCFNDAKVALKFGSFEQYKKYLSWDEDRKTEWDIELEMVLVEPDKGGVTQFEPFFSPKLTDDGYVKIINIK